MCTQRMKIAAAKEREQQNIAADLLPVALRSCLSPMRFRLVFLSGITIFLFLSVVYPLLAAQDMLFWSRDVASAAVPPTIIEPRSFDVLHYTALDPSEAAEKEKIKQLLDTSEGTRGHRLEGKILKFDPAHHLEGYERRPFLRRFRERSPNDLSNPRYVPYMAQFRQMLQNWARKKRYEPQIMKELLPALKEPIDRHYNAVGVEVDFGRRYRTCAVVGNSGILLNRTYGQFIDSHEMVMRLNNARIIGFEKWVGSRTTLSFVNSNIVHTCSRRIRCSCPTYGESVPTVSYICQVAHFMDVIYCGSFRRSPILVTDPRFDSLSTRIVRYYSLRNFFQTTGKSYDDWNKLHDGAFFHYSSGMQAVMLALGICDKVDVLGFGKLPNTSHHYHTNQKKELALHDYEAEYIFYDDLANNRSHLIPFLNESGIAVPPVQIFL